MIIRKSRVNYRLLLFYNCFIDVYRENNFKDITMRFKIVLEHKLTTDL